MQFQSESLNTVVDYYEVKYFIPYGTEVSKNVRLKVVTYKGKTFERAPINVYDMAEEIDELLEHNFAVTINTKRPAQFMSRMTVDKVAQARTKF